MLWLLYFKIAHFLLATNSKDCHGGFALSQPFELSILVTMDILDVITIYNYCVHYFGGSGYWMLLSLGCSFYDDWEKVEEVLKVGGYIVYVLDEDAYRMLTFLLRIVCRLILKEWSN